MPIIGPFLIVCNMFVTLPMGPKGWLLSARCWTNLELPLLYLKSCRCSRYLFRKVEREPLYVLTECTVISEPLLCRTTYTHHNQSVTAVQNTICSTIIEYNRSETRRQARRLTIHPSFQRSDIIGKPERFITSWQNYTKF